MTDETLFDSRKFMKYTSEYPEWRLDIMNAFVFETPGVLADLERTLHDKNLVAAKRQLHKLRSSLSFFASTDVVSELQFLEDNLNESEELVQRTLKMVLLVGGLVNQLQQLIHTS